MNIIISGCGKIGQAILAELAEEGHDVIAIDINSQKLEAVNDVYDIMGVCGNCVNAETLTDAQIESADLFIATTGSDEINILSCALASRFGVANTVARIRNPEYKDRQIGFMRHEFGISMVINPELIVAQELFGLVRLPAATKIERFSVRNFALIEQRIKDGSPFDGITLSEMSSKYKSDVLVCAVQRGNETVVPGGNFTLKAGDRISIAANFSELQRLMRLAGTYRKKSRNVMILGGSKTAVYLAKMLLAAGGNTVKIIERDYDKCLSISEALPNAIVINGDGSDQELLQQEGLDNTEAFIALTGSDEENILISLFAQSHNVPQVITKVNSRELGVMSEKLGLDNVVSVKSTTSDVLTGYARALKKSKGGEMETLYSIMDGTAEALEFNVTEKSKLTSKPLKDLDLKKNTLIAAIFRHGKVIVPKGDDVIEVGDRVIAVATKQHIKNFTDILD